MQTHIKFASDLGIILARAKFAIEDPKGEEKKGFWTRLPPEQKAILLKLGQTDGLVSRQIIESNI
jgi:hypothetical protein